MKKFTKFELAALKRNAKNVAPLFTKKARVEAEIIKLNGQITDINTQIEALDSGTRIITGGYSTEQIFKRVRISAGKDKNGNEIYANTFVFRYPETIIPVEEVENTEEMNNEDVENVENNNIND